MAKIKKAQEGGTYFAFNNGKLARTYPAGIGSALRGVAAMDTTGYSKGKKSFVLKSDIPGEPKEKTISRDKVPAAIAELKKGATRTQEYRKPKKSAAGTKLKKAQDGKKVRLKEDSRAYITKVKTDDKGNITSLKSRRTVKGLLTGAPRAKKIMKSGGKVVKKSTSKSKKK
jgi:hypothetical protein